VYSNNFLWRYKVDGFYGRLLYSVIPDSPRFNLVTYYRANRKASSSVNPI